MKEKTTNSIIILKIVRYKTIAKGSKPKILLTSQQTSKGSYITPECILQNVIAYYPNYYKVKHSEFYTKYSFYQIRPWESNQNFKKARFQIVGQNKDKTDQIINTFKLKNLQLNIFAI